MAKAVTAIEDELAGRLAELEKQGDLLEAQRLRMRTTYDLEIIRQVGFCSGTGNYPRHNDGRGAGTAPATLTGYFPPEDNHQNFIKRNPNNPYVVQNDLPKLRGLEQRFPDMLK